MRTTDEVACTLSELLERIADLVAERDRYREALEWIVEHAYEDREGLSDIARGALK